MSLDLDMDVGYVRSVIEGNEPYSILKRGVSSVADFYIAKDSESFLDSLVEKYDLQFGLRVSHHPEITFSPFADGKKTVMVLRDKGLIVPPYIEEIIFYGKTTAKLSKERCDIFKVGDDPNAGGKVREYAERLQLPIETILERWDFSLFSNPQEIQDNLRQAIEEECPHSELKRFVGYNTDKAEVAYKLTNNLGVVKNLFGDNEWRENAVGYAKALMDAVIQGIEKEKDKNIEIQKEFLDKVLALFSYYRERFV